MQLLSKLIFAVLATSVPTASFAAAVVESSSGDVRVFAPGASGPMALKPGQSLPSASTVIAGADGQAILRFEDESKIALLRNSELSIVDYHYDPGAASSGRAEFRLRRGALRIVTGLIARRNPQTLVVHTPHVDLRERGTDFSVAIVGESYWSVNEGAVAATTQAGTGVFGKGSYGRSASLDRLPVGASRAGLPLDALARFNEMNSPTLTAQLGPGPGGVSAGAAALPSAESAGPGLSTGGMMAILGAAAAAIAAAANSGGGGGATTTTSH